MNDTNSPEQESKRLCPSTTIGTHDGTFHCDEALACSLLKMLPEYKNADIVRTRKPDKLDECDIVVDVGGVYNPGKHRYDHHQRDFTGTMKSLCQKKWDTKLSSAGLVYLHFGRRILQQLLETAEDNPLIEILYDKVYENFIEEIDAIDNGVDQYEGEPRYKVTTNLSSRVSGLNPKWNDKSPEPQSQFVKAMALTNAEFIDRISYYRDSWLPARTLVEKAVEKRFEVDPSGEIIVFSEGGCPWKEHLFNIEEEKQLSPTIKFSLFQDQNGKWRVQCVPVRLTSFENRISLLSEWRGVRDSALSDISGIPGCIFVHASGFIGGNETYEGALEMATRTLKQSKTEKMQEA